MNLESGKAQAARRARIVGSLGERRNPDVDGPPPICVTVASIMKLLASLALLVVAACGSPPAPTLVASVPTCPSAAASAAPAPDASAPSADADTLAPRIVAMINDEDADGLFALFGPAMKEALPVPRVLAFMRSLIASKGKIASVTPVTPGHHDRNGSYRAHAKEGDWDMAVALDAQGLLAGFKLTEPTAPEPPMVKSDVPLALPFRGAWSVFWGGDTLELNQHVTQPSQRRAADLVIRGADGKTHRGDGKKNDDYLAWDQDVLAAADGKVTMAIDGVPENEPGTLNPYFALGNAVLVEHGPKLYSLYAHFRPGSLRVKSGALVKRGQVLGKCGNSGNSSEPHLHFHLQDGPLTWKSWGVEAVFASVSLTRGSETTSPTAYTFLKGDRVADGGRR